MIKAILAVTNDGGIRFKGSLPWPKNPEDLKWFKKHTVGHVVVMGRKTWDDPMMPKPLPKRTNIVLTSDPFEMDGVYCIEHIDAILNFAAMSKKSDQDVYIIGGKTLYETTFPIVDEILLTRIEGNYETDVKINLTSILESFTLTYKQLSKGCSYEIWRKT